MILRATAFPAFAFTMYAANGVPATGLTITATRSLDGAAFAACANAAVEVSGGVYLIDLAAADLDAACVTFRFVAPGADTTLVTVFPGDYGVDGPAKWSGELCGGGWLSNGETFRFTAAGAVILIPFEVKRAFVVKRALVYNGGTVNGNTTVGVLSSARVLLASTAATAQAGASVGQIIDFTAATTLAAGRYFTMLSNDGTTGLYRGLGAGPLAGDAFSITSLGIRAVASGGIVTLPTIVDPSASYFRGTSAGLFNNFPDVSILGFAANELVA